MRATAGVLLNGCGHRDGSEIQESVLSMLALEQEGFQLKYLSLDESQPKIYNHLSGEEIFDEKRNILLESARISRGAVKSIENYSIDDLDVLVIPGGFGCAYNLCTYAESGPVMTVNQHVETLINNAFNAKKPIGAICIAPILLAKVLGRFGVKLTLGTTGPVSEDLEKMGAKHKETSPGDCCVDEDNLIVTSPAYMFGNSSLSDIWRGVRGLALELKRLNSYG